MPSAEEAISELKSDPKRLAEVRLLMERTATEKAKRERERGEWLPRAEVEKGRIERIEAVHDKMRQLIDLAPEIADQSVDKVSEILTQWVVEVCDEFSK